MEIDFKGTRHEIVANWNRFDELKPMIIKQDLDDSKKKVYFRVIFDNEELLAVENIEYRDYEELQVYASGVYQDSFDGYGMVDDFSFELLEGMY